MGERFASNRPRIDQGVRLVVIGELCSSDGIKADPIYVQQIELAVETLHGIVPLRSVGDLKL